MIGLQCRELGLEGLEQLGATPLLPLGFLTIQAEDVAASAFAPTTIGPDHHLFGAEVGVCFARSSNEATPVAIRR
jgi:hypothetical protein